MSSKPIFCCTHPRACSTAFERVFMTHRDTLQCIHEPFGDAFYYGPERMSTRFANDEQMRISSGFSKSTYKTIFDRLEREGSEGKRLFIKDIIYYLVPPKDQPAMIAPSLVAHRRGVGTNGQVTGVPKSGSENGEMYPWSTKTEPNNPTVIPSSMLRHFHWAFLIRDPHRAIPSYFRCTIPPLDEMTGFYEFYPSEAGYSEVRRVFDYLRSIGMVGPHQAQIKQNANGTTGTNGIAHNGITTNGHSTSDAAEICVLDADDMLDYPPEYLEAYCNSIGVPYEPSMLEWAGEEHQATARAAFEKWRGFHEDVMNSTGLEAREKKQHEGPAKAEEDWDKEWKDKFGENGAKIIRETVDDCMEDYLYLKQFALQL